MKSGYFSFIKYNGKHTGLFFLPSFLYINDEFGVEAGKQIEYNKFVIRKRNCVSPDETPSYNREVVYIG
ncbi:hypothetical protein M2298_003352 [Brevibacillus sp. 1238]|jgi:hypothetical protein|uniref:Uncharacterized protein n=1 Tax=Brevibacillus parabrevis TaxID=54914 RepID=A0A4Y3PEF6_BREPA|nr:hypothetical protein [Brevibacillus sp. 1238]GEB32920.1 hypothetical protein BPA01_25000 [Brevibacillus parabrevis]